MCTAPLVSCVCQHVFRGMPRQSHVLWYVRDLVHRRHCRRCKLKNEERCVRFDKNRLVRPGKLTMSIFGSSPPTASSSPSCEKPSALMLAVRPAYIPCDVHSLTSHSATMLSTPADAAKRIVGSHLTQKTVAVCAVNVRCLGQPIEGVVVPVPLSSCIASAVEVAEAAAPVKEEQSRTASVL